MYNIRTARLPSEDHDLKDRLFFLNLYQSRKRSESGCRPWCWERAGRGGRCSGHGAREATGAGDVAGGTMAVSGKTLLQGKIIHQNFLPREIGDICTTEGIQLHFSSFSFQAAPCLEERERQSADQPPASAALTGAAWCNRRTWLPGSK